MSRIYTGGIPTRKKYPRENSNYLRDNLFFPWDNFFFLHDCKKRHGIRVSEMPTSFPFLCFAVAVDKV